MEIDVSEVKDYEEYAYALGTLKSKENKLISKKHMIELALVSDFKSLINGLSDTNYGPYLNRAASPLEYELSVERAFSDEIIETGKLLSSKKRWVVDIIRIKYDFFNFKILLRSRIFRKSPSETSFSLIGSIPPSILVELASLNDDEFITRVSEYGYSKDLLSAFEVYKNSQDLAYLDNSLDKSLFSRIFSTIPLNNEGNFFRNYWKVVVDSTNLLSYLRLKREGKDSQFNKYYIPNGNLLESDITEMSFGKSPISELWDDIKDDYEKNASLTSFEMKTKAYLQKYVRETKLLKSMAPETVAGYLLEKEHEAQNIRLLLALKEKGVTPKIIEQLVRDSYV